MSDPVLEALWKKVVDDWDEERGHSAFLEHTRSTNQLLEAAVRYRGMVGDHVRGPSAEKRLQAIAVLAMAALESQRSAPPPGRARLVVQIVIIVLSVVASLLLLYDQMK